MIDKRYITHAREPFFEIAKDLIKIGDKVLDIGSGNGSFAEYCCQKDIFMFEGNSDSVINLKKKYPNVFEGRLPVLPFEDNTFDLIHMSHVIEHLDQQTVYDTLKEFDRCCKTGGIIIISAPLMWQGFYDDLSHIKPYPPFIFQKYLCDGDYKNLSRIKISNKFIIERLQYRYIELPKKIIERKRDNFINKVVFKTYNIFKNRFFKSYITSGYTVVLRKQNI